MFSTIPLPDPEHARKTFADVFDYLEQVKKRKMEEPLKAAQAQQAQMMARLINAAMGGGGQMGGIASGQPGMGSGGAMPGMGGSPTSITESGERATPEEVARIANQGNGAGPPQGQGGGVANPMLASALLGLPTHVVEGNLITPFGNVKVGESEQEKRLGQARGKAAEKTLESTAETSLGALPVNASFKALDKLMDHPSYDNIAGTFEGKYINAQPFGMPVGAALQRSFPGKFSKEDANLAGQVQAHFGNIVSGVAQKFKGPFKAMVQGVINDMKPNMGDSKSVQKGKITALKQLSDLADRQNAQIANYTSSGMEPTAAILKVAHEEPLQPFLEQITSKVPEEANNPSGTTIMYKNNVEYHIPNGKVKGALKSGYSYGR